ncbi:MAG: hypothetical protein Q8N53_12610 [Longimicrobiales bacterium]|nr:hypothetical protein [Longimicrobiales bacterium]
MSNGWRSHINLLHLAPVGAIALVVSAWPVSADADAEETFQVTIISQNPMRTGDLCTAYANVSGGTGPYEFTWSGDLWWGSNSGYSSYRQETFYEPGVYTQTLEAWDYFDNYAMDVRMGLVVNSDDESACVER